MKQFILTLLIIISLFIDKQSYAQTIWTGSTITVSKPGGADISLPENQDVMTANAILVRASTKGFFNLAIETEAGNTCNSTSPHDIEWAFGSVADYATLNYDTFMAQSFVYSTTGGCQPPSFINRPMVVHLITDDIYMDFKLISWSTAAGGASYSYIRSTENTASLNNLASFNFNFYPNPTKGKLNLNANKKITNITITNLLGQKVKSYTTSALNITINIENLTSGTYFIKVEINNKIGAFKIIKE